MAAAHRGSRILVSTDAAAVIRQPYNPDRTALQGDPRVAFFMSKQPQVKGIKVLLAMPILSGIYKILALSVECRHVFAHFGMSCAGIHIRLFSKWVNKFWPNR